MKKEKSSEISRAKSKQKQKLKLKSKSEQESEEESGSEDFDEETDEEVSISLHADELKALILLQSPNGAFRSSPDSKLEKKLNEIILQEKILKPNAKKLFFQNHKRDWWIFLCCLYFQKFGKEEHKFILDKVQNYLQKQKISIAHFIQ